jgi:hypothetical protein
MQHLLLAVVASIDSNCVASAQSAKLTGTDPENLVLSPQKSGEHRVFWNDIRSGSYGRGVLMDTEKHQVLSKVYLGWEGGKVEWSSSGADS